MSILDVHTDLSGVKEEEDRAAKADFQDIIVADEEPAERSSSQKRPRFLPPINSRLASSVQAHESWWQSQRHVQGRS